MSKNGIRYSEGFKQHICTQNLVLRANIVGVDTEDDFFYEKAFSD